MFGHTVNQRESCIYRTNIMSNMRALIILYFVSKLSIGLTFLLDDRCPDCHWNGVCDVRHRVCKCYDGFKGTDCHTDCGCAGHGVCNTDNTCNCDAGWKWSASQHQCIWDCNCPHGVSCIAPGVCGCPHTCQYGTCWNGQCECWEGYKGNTCSVYDVNIMMNRNISVGLNIGGISYWSSELKFVDIAKQSQEWITERLDGAHSHEWDTHEHDVIQWRSDGYPASLPTSLVVLKLMLRADSADAAPKGNYTVLYDGDGELQFRLVHHTIHYNGKGRMVVDFQEGHGGIALKIVKTNPANPIHNIRIVMPGFEARYQNFPFYPPFVDFLKRFSELRFMDFFHTNAHTPEPTTWSTRRHQDFHTQTGSPGAAIEYAILLSNIVGASPWFPQPHAADDDFLRQFAALTKKSLRPELKIYIEYSNEVWNGIFRQTHYCQEQGTKLGLDPHAYRAGKKYYNKRSAEVMDIWASVFSGSEDRLVTTWAWQTGYKDYTRQAMADLGNRTSHFKALAITGYFNCDNVVYNHNITALSFGQIQQYCQDDLVKSETNFKYYMDMAKSHKLKLLMYEGGPGLESSRAHNDNVTKQAIAFHRHGLMEDAVTDVLEAWFTIVNSDPYNTPPGGLFNYFSSTGTPSKYGSWGMLEYTGQDSSTVPKYRAVQRYIERHFNNHVLGPACSVIVSSGSHAFACFKQGHFRCGTSTNQGTSWSFYPEVTGTQSSIMILDGYDSVSGFLFVRSLDDWASNTYFTIDTAHPTRWKMQTYLEYNRLLADPEVQRRLPNGVYGGLHTASMNCD